MWELITVKNYLNAASTSLIDAYNGTWEWSKDIEDGSEAFGKDVLEHEHKIKLLLEKNIQNECQSRRNNIWLSGVDDNYHKGDREKLLYMT